MKDESEGKTFETLDLVVRTYVVLKYTVPVD